MTNPLADLGWDYVVSTNQEICRKSGYQHGITSDGYVPAKMLFDEAAARKNLDLPDVVDTLRMLHKISPFLFLNGNTFSNIGKTTLLMVGNNPSNEIRSIVGHHIAGTAILDKKELEKAFRKEAEKTDLKKKVSLKDARRINDGFLKHEGLELPESLLPFVVKCANGEMTQEEAFALIDARNE